jgi:hypothetical protein
MVTTQGKDQQTATSLKFAFGNLAILDGSDTSHVIRGKSPVSRVDFKMLMP